MERRVLLSTFTVDNTADNGPGSLRWAVVQVNADTTQSTINFNIPGAGVQTIALSSALAPITRPVVIEGRSQPGYSGLPLIRLDGQALSGNPNGLVLSGGGGTVAGLIVTGFQGAGIVLTAGGGNVVESCSVGLDPSRYTAQPNGDGVVVLHASANTIGGPASAAGNLISGNLGNGVKIVGNGLDTVGNQVFGNRIGTTRDGLGGLGNGLDGILISGGGDTAVGGASGGLGNLISANGNNGLEVNSSATGTQIVGNAIGLTTDGAHALGNRFDGVVLDSAPSTTIGGLTVGAANQISGNNGNGVRTRGDSAGTVIEGNQIGTDAQAVLKLGNLGVGLLIGAGSTVIGGFSQGAGNTIAFNGSGSVGAGVQFSGVVTGVSILSNSIHDNAGLGIAFGDGPTPNHDPKSGPGPNNWQNYPVLTTAQANGGTSRLSGTLTAAPAKTYTIQVFWSPQPDPSGFGEGTVYLGQDTATTDQTGQVTFNIPNLGGALPGGFLSVTATSPSGDTSEFSQAILVQPVSDVGVVLSANPVLAAQGAAVTFQAVVTNHGNLTVHHVALTAQFPGAMAVASTAATQGTSTVVQQQSVAAALGALAPGTSAVVTVVAWVPADFQGDLVVSAQTTMDELDAHPENDAASVTIHVAATADLAVTLANGPTTAHPGDPLSYTLVVSNAGPSSATNVVLAVPLSTVASYATVAATQGTASLQADRLLVNLGTVAAGAQVQITVVFKATTPGVFVSTAGLTSDEVDPNLSDDQVELSTVVRPLVDLRLAMQAPTIAADGRNVTYGVTVANAGPNDATGVTIKDVLPTLAAYVGAALENGGAASFADGVVTAAVGDLAAGASTTLWIVAVPNAAVGTILTNTAQTTSDQDDANPADNVVSRDTPVRPVGDLSVVITPASSTLPHGQPGTFSVQVLNNGPSVEPNAVLSLPVPDWANLVTCSLSQGGAPAVSNGTIVARLGAIAPGASARVTVVLSPKATAQGTVAATAWVLGDDADFNLNDNEASATVTITPASDLSVVVNPPSTSPLEQSTFTYTVVVTANGPDDASGVVVRAPIPSGVEFVDAQASQGDAPLLSGGAVVARVGCLAVGSSATLTVRVRSTGAVGSSLMLTGTAVQDQFDPAPSNTAIVSVVLQPAVDLQVVLGATLSRMDVGQSVLWGAHVANLGPSTATGVVMNLPVGAGWTPLWSTSTQGAIQTGPGWITVQLGTIAPGAAASLVFAMIPTVAGASTLTARASADQRDLHPGDDQASATVAVDESPGVITFGQPSFTTPETSGAATIAVYRTLGTRGAVTVPYATWGGNATPGVDYLPVFGVLSFGPGESVKYVTVPILANPHDNHDETVDLYLGWPTGGASSGRLSVATLTIQDVDPDFTPPQVQSIQLNGDANWVASLTVGFSEPLNTNSALNGAGYGLIDLGVTGMLGAGDSRWIGIEAPTYNPTTSSVVITPSQPLAAGRAYAVVVKGTGAAAVTDLAGNPLGGGVDYVSSFIRGTSPNYFDSLGNLVSFQVAGGGFLDVFRNAAGDAQRVSLQQGVPGSTTLSGSVSRWNGRGTGTTSVGVIDGLGAFGQVRMNLKSPPFMVKSYPFALSTGSPIATRPAVAPRVPPTRPIPPARRIPQVRPAALRMR